MLCFSHELFERIVPGRVRVALGLNELDLEQELSSVSEIIYDDSYAEKRALLDW